jgi:hypothetical protein
MIAVLLILSVVVATTLADAGILSLEFAGKRAALQQGNCADSNPCT